jgi:ABC-type branched-subunit amino acid transport system substrate-binding protein
MRSWVPVRTRAVGRFRASVPARVRGGALALCGALAIAGCASNATPGSSTITVSGHTLTVFGSQPPGGSGGQAATDMLDAERLALQQTGGKAGGTATARYTVQFRALDGSELSDNARTAIEDPTAIAYLGELQPGTSQISVEITNQQGLLVISPADTSAYLTQPVPPVSNSPTSYYPSHSTYHETFARVVTTTAIEAKAIVQEMQAEHVLRVFVDSNGGLYGASVATEVRRAAKAAGLEVVNAPASADGIFYGASIVSPTARREAIQTLAHTAAASPTAKLFVPSGLYDSSFAAGLSSTVARRLVVSSPGFLPQDLSAPGRTFVADFKQAYGHAPAPEAIFGYEAMSALLHTLDQIGPLANNRAAVVDDFRSLKNPPNSVIGPYSIQGGDPTIAPLIFARIRSGHLVPFKFVQLQG